MNHKMIASLRPIALMACVGLLLMLTLVIGQASSSTWGNPTEAASIPESQVRAVASVTPGVPAYQAGSWVYTGGPIGGLGYDVRMDPRNPDVMYVTDALAGAFKSVDGGANWVPINNGITTRVGTSSDAIPVFSLTLDPNNPDRLWVGTQYSNDVFRSDDAGATWTNMNSGITEVSLTTRGFTVEPGNSSVVYLAGEVSSWEWNGSPLWGVLFDMTKGVVYKTTNAGQSWTRIWYGDNLARYIWIHPTNHNLLYVSTGIFDREAANSDREILDPGGVGILRSKDGGTTWEELGESNGVDADDLYFGSLYMHPTNPNILLAAASNDAYRVVMGRDLGGIYRSANGGDTWTEVLGTHDFTVVEICESDPNVVYAAALQGVYRSMDSGLTWQKLVGESWGAPDAIAGFPIDAQCDPRDTMRVFINNYGGGNLLSEDGGSTWTVSSTGYTGASMRQVAVAQDDPARIYASARSGIFTSGDGGATWSGLAYGAARNMEAFALAVDPSDPAHILATELDAGPEPLVSRDGGQTWGVVDTGLWPAGETSPEDEVTQIVFAPTDSQLVFATVGLSECSTTERCDTTPGRGIIVSRNGGDSWATTSITVGQVLGFAVSPQDSSRAYAAVYDGSLYRSSDSGATWQVVNQNPAPSSSAALGLDGRSKLALMALAIVPGSPDKLYAGYLHQAVAISEDGGVTWTASATGMPAEADVAALVIDPTDSEVVYAGTLDAGVFVSINGGSTWTALNNGLMNRAVRGMALSHDGTILYVASDGGGVFRLGTPPLTTATPTPTLTPTDTPVPTMTTTPTPSATVTPTTAPCEGILPNGDFETGLVSPWGASGGTQITSALAHGGEQGVLVGGANNAIDELSVGIELPSDAASITLSYWWYIESDDPGPDADRLLVVLEPPGDVVEVELLTNSSPKDAWYLTAFDLSSNAGQFTGLTFRVETDEAHLTTFFLDDVEVQVCGAAPPGQRVNLPLIMKGG